jgi:hypothetical protein
MARACIPNNAARARLRGDQHYISIMGLFAGSFGEKIGDHRPEGDVELVATRVSAGVAAIFDSTSSTGFLVQACVT